VGPGRGASKSHTLYAAPPILQATCADVFQPAYPAWARTSEFGRAAPRVTSPTAAAATLLQVVLVVGK
jgi:hypothetical protein